MILGNAWLPIFVILLLKIHGTKGSCYWNTGDGARECHVYCINETPESMKHSLETEVRKVVECHEKGIWLLLRSQIFPNQIMNSNWFTADVKVLRLDVSMSPMPDVSVDAFVSNAFRTVKILNFENFGVELIRNGIFNGMEELEILNINGANKIRTIENGVLDSLNELKEFTFVQSLSANPVLNINGFTGSGQLAKLEYVKFTYKLTNTIRETTLNGLTNVKILDLSNCQIDFIGDNAFDPIINTIEVLLLNRNLLTTIPAGLFDRMLPKDGLIIDLTGNRWLCNCELISLRITLEQFEHNFKGPIECTPSGECLASNILESECFNDCVTPPTSPPTTSTTTTTTTTINPIEYFRKECHKPSESEFSDIVSVKQPSTYMTITETESGDVNLNLDNQDTSSVVIWFSENDISDIISDEDINCISQDESTSIPFTNLKENVIYSFCLMDKQSANVSPLDFVSYIKRRHGNDSVWLLQSNKTLTVTLIVLSLVLIAVFGIGIGFWILNYNPFSKCGSSKKSNESIQSKPPVPNNVNNRSSNAYQRKASNITTNSGNTMITTRTTVQYDTSPFNVPPLPERIPNMRRFEEPVYSTVEDIYKDF